MSGVVIRRLPNKKKLITAYIMQTKNDGAIILDKEPLNSKNLTRLKVYN